MMTLKSLNLHQKMAHTLSHGYEQTSPMILRIYSELLLCLSMVPPEQKRCSALLRPGGRSKPYMLYLQT